MLPFFSTSGWTIACDVLDQLADLERLQEQVHPAGLDLGEVQDVVDQPEQVLAGRVDLLEIRDERLLAEVLGLLLEHLGVADDGVQRRPQLVGHVRQELRLVLAAPRQAARFASWSSCEQPGVLDGDDAWSANVSSRAICCVGERPDLAPSQMRDAATRIGVASSERSRQWRIRGSHGLRVPSDLGLPIVVTWTVRRSEPAPPASWSIHGLHVARRRSPCAESGDDAIGIRRRSRWTARDRGQEPLGARDDRVEDGLEIGGRGCDHAQDLGGRGLLLQRRCWRASAREAPLFVLASRSREQSSASNSAILAYGSSAIMPTPAALPCCATAPG